MVGSRNRILDIQQVSSYLRVGKSTVWKLIKEEGLPSCKIGRRRLFKEDDLDAWLKAKTKTSLS